mgnify:CR=1 FL=1
MTFNDVPKYLNATAISWLIDHTSDLKGRFMKTFVMPSTPTPVSVTPGTSTAAQAESPPPPTRSAPTHNDIARRAYAIYIGTGRQHGFCKENWQQAERELGKVSPIRRPGETTSSNVAPSTRAQ